MARERIPVLVRPVPTKKPARWAHKCGFTKLDGVLCERWAIAGGYVCPKHGGRLPPVKARARARLSALALVAVAVYTEVLDNPRAKDSDRLRAAQDVLRMCGFTSMGIRTPGTRRSLQEPRELLPGFLMLGSGDPVDDEIEKLLSKL